MRSGFSIVELAVVLGLAAAALTLATSGRSLVTERRLAGMARTIVTDIRMIEQRARAERTCYRIYFDTAAEAYTISGYHGAVAPGGGSQGAQCPDVAAWDTAPAIAEASGDTVSRRMPNGIDLVTATFPGVGGTRVLTVSPLGNGDAGTVTLRSAGGATRQIVIEVFGRVRIQP